eukprot:6204689-Pleurochrysis_carterae.AAC.2
MGRLPPQPLHAHRVPLDAWHRPFSALRLLRWVSSPLRYSSALQTSSLAACFVVGESFLSLIGSPGGFASYVSGVEGVALVKFVSPTCAFAHAQANARARARARARTSARTNAHTHTRTRSRTYTYTQTRTHTRTSAHTHFTPYSTHAHARTPTVVCACTPISMHARARALERGRTNKSLKCTRATRAHVCRDTP